MVAVEQLKHHRFVAHHPTFNIRCGNMSRLSAVQRNTMILLSADVIVSMERDIGNTDMRLI